MTKQIVETVKIGMIDRIGETVRIEETVRIDRIMLQIEVIAKIVIDKIEAINK